MKRAPSDTPNLDDILQRDFAELKVGEQHLPETAPPKKAEEQPAESPQRPKVYNQRINAVEDREVFAVKPPQAAKTEETSEQTSTPTVLKTPSAQPGDDFDVEW
ncbi:MAG: hypothetical protein ACPGKR_01625 [Poseidonia sp.]